MTAHSEMENEYLTPVRGLNEYAYCPRLFHLMYIQGLFEESLDTLEGRIAHSRRQNKTKAVADKEEEAEPELPWRNDLVREMSLSSKNFLIHGKFDVLLEKKDEMIPVEVKRGPAPDGKSPFLVGPVQLAGTAWGNDQVQLAAQILLLKEAGYNCHRGRIYYRKTKTLVDILWSDSLEAALRWVSEQTKALVGAPMPEPLVDSKKCIRCSLNHVCLPDETLHIQGKLVEPRQLYPGRDDCGILYLTTPGTRLGKSGEAAK